MPSTKKPKQTYFKELFIEGRYKDFNDFYDENKPIIYKSIIEIFLEFKKTKKNGTPL